VNDRQPLIAVVMQHTCSSVAWRSCWGPSGWSVALRPSKTFAAGRVSTRPGLRPRLGRWGRAWWTWWTRGGLLPTRFPRHARARACGGMSHVTAPSDGLATVPQDTYNSLLEGAGGRSDV
jgi:hypothetical protein